MRVEKTIKNIKVAMLYQLTILLIGFIDRKLFLSVLGVNYLGFHGLFGNIITMLSLAELGVGTAIIYNLYKPLEDENKEEVAALMQLYKKVYYVIGAAIGVIGIILMFFLPTLIKEPMQNMTYVRGIYLVFLAGTVLTYLTGYKRAVLYADQKNYILLLGDMAGNTIGVIAKIITLLTLKNYMAYVVVHAGFKVLPNIWASYQVNKLYPYINKLRVELPVEKLKNIKENIKDLFIHKISHFVVTSTDSLIISSFIGISIVGYLANYNMIIGALMGFVAQGVEALQASMGNLIVSRSKEKVEEVYDRLTFASFWIGSFCAVALVCLVQPFIKLWLGPEYFLENSVVLIIIVNFFLWILTRPLWQMMTVAGLFKEDKINALVEIVVNLVVSLVLVHKLGLVGVLLGTMISYIVAWIMKSRLLYRRFFKKSYRYYYGKIIIYGLITVVEVLITYGICKKISVGNYYIRFILQAMTCLVIPNVINIILFIKANEFKYFERLIKGVMMQMIEKLREEELFDRIQKMLFVIMAVLLFVLPIELTRIPYGPTIGKIVVRTVFASSGLYIVYLLLIGDFTSRKSKKRIWIYILLALTLTITSFTTGGIVATKTTLKSIFVFNTFIAFLYIDYSKMGKRFYILDVGFVTYIIFIIVYYFVLRNDPSAHGIFFRNPNTLGLVLALVTFICLLLYSITNSKRYLIYTIPFMWIVILSKSRTSMLALGAAAVTYVLWRLLTKYKRIYYGYFALIITMIIIVTVCYPLLNEIGLLEEANQKIIEYTGKRLLTGREIIWLESISLIIKKPLIGYGMGATLEELTGGTLTAHNVYLQLLLQGGILLLTPFIMYIGWIWKNMWKVRNNAIVQAGASCLVGILVVGTFELSLFDQLIPVGIIQWFIIGLGLSPAVYNNRITKEIKEMD